MRSYHNLFEGFSILPQRDNPLPQSQDVFKIQRAGMGKKYTKCVYLFILEALYHDKEYSSQLDDCSHVKKAKDILTKSCHPIRGSNKCLHPFKILHAGSMGPVVTNCATFMSVFVEPIYELAFTLRRQMIHQSFTCHVSLTSMGKALRTPLYLPKMHEDAYMSHHHIYSFGESLV